MFCKHQWKLLDKEIIPAPLDRFKEIVKGTLPRWMFNTKVIQIFTCGKCGKIQKFETDSHVTDSYGTDSQ